MSRIDLLIPPTKRRQEETIKHVNKSGTKFPTTQRGISKNT